MVEKMTALESRINPEFLSDPSFWKMGSTIERLKMLLYDEIAKEKEKR
jgi:hypothetical protein